MVKGDKCWIIENCFKVLSVDVLSVSGNLVLIKTQNGNTLRLPKHRLYDSEEKAKVALKVYKPEKKNTRYDYM